MLEKRLLGGKRPFTFFKKQKPRRCGNMIQYIMTFTTFYTIYINLSTNLTLKNVSKYRLKPFEKRIDFENANEFFIQKRKFFKKIISIFLFFCRE
jgi:hypothetical protein